MQRQTVVVVVVLVTIALLFVMGIGVGLLRSDGKGSSHRDAARRGQEGWTAGLGSLLAPFGPKADLGGLKCAGQPVSAPFRLDAASSSCSFQFDPADSDRPRQATLGISPLDALVYVRSEGQPGEGVEPDPACRPEGSLPRDRLALIVAYAPCREGSRARPCSTETLNKPCWLPVDPVQRRTASGTRKVLEVGFAVLKDGGIVSLERRCEGCAEERRLELEFAR